MYYMCNILYVHVRTLHVQCTYTICTMYTTCTMYIHYMYMYIPYVYNVRHMYNVRTHVQCTYTTCTMHAYYIHVMIFSSQIGHSCLILDDFMAY